MRTTTLMSVGFVSLIASSAMAGTIMSPAALPTVKTPTTATNYPTHSGPEAVVSFDVSGYESWDGYNSANNDTANYDIAAALGAPSGSEVTVTGIGWDVNITAIGTSWQSELAVSMDTGDAAEEVWLRPGIAVSSSGTGSFSSGGMIALSTVGLPNIVLPNGIMPMEFFESFDDGAGVLDGTWNSGSLSFEATAVIVPEPTTLGLLALGSLISLRRARRA